MYCQEMMADYENVIQITMLITFITINTQAKV